MRNRRAIPLIVYLILLVVVFSWAGDLFSDSLNQLPYSTVVDLIRDEQVKKLEVKGFIKREDPGFICTPLISQNQMQKVEAVSLVKKVFGGSRKALFSALLEDEPLSDEEIDELRKLIDNR